MRNTLAAAILLFLSLSQLTVSGARGAAPPYDTVAPYDLATLGVPKFINANFIDLAEVNQLTKFRSDAGHDYSDNLEFGTEGLPDPNSKYNRESCRSMKHYFYGPDKGTPMYSPVAGMVTSVNGPNAANDMEIGIQPDAQPAFGINIFHVLLDSPLTVGQHLTEGQRIGVHPGAPYLANDIAVFVKTTQGFHLISYFEALTDAAFAPFKARGLASPNDLIYSEAQRDAAQYTCNGLTFVSPSPDPNPDYFNLTGGAAAQNITFGAIPTLVRVSDPPVTISATATSGQPVTITSTTPTICTAAGNTITPIAAGSCGLQFTQAGVPDQLHAVSFAIYNMTVIAGLNAGPIFSSAQADAQSFLRFYNTGTSAGTVTATLYDSASGQNLGQWTSPSIPAGSEQQYPIRTLEAAMTHSTAQSQYYSLLVQTQMSGYFQHVLWRPNAGVLANLTTCAFGNGSDSSTLSAVHTTNVGAAGYPSSIVINNTGDAATVALDIYDARNGAKLGTYTTGQLPANGRVILNVTDMEAGANVHPTSDMAHYVVMAEAPFTGFLQHLVNNQKPGVTTDMTAQCSLDSNPPPFVPEPIQTGIVYSSINPSQQSYIRIGNTDYSRATTATVTLNDYATGKPLGTWTSPSIPPFTAQQFSIATLEKALDPSAQKPAYYSLSFGENFGGYFQHVVWNTAAGTLTNLTSCSSGISNAYPLQTPFVHSSLDVGYPSTVSINSINTTPSTWVLYYSDPQTNLPIASIYSIFNLLSLPSNGAKLIDVDMSEGTAFKPPAGRNYYQATAEMETNQSVAGQAGYLQHLVTSQQSGVIDNLTSICPVY